MQNDAHTHIVQQRLENDKANAQFMVLDADKENKYLETLFFFLSVARVKQFASTAFSGGIAALFENARSHCSDRNQCSSIETRSNAG